MLFIVCSPNHCSTMRTGNSGGLSILAALCKLKFGGSRPSGVTRGHGGGADRPGGHHPWGWHSNEIIFVAEFTKNTRQTMTMLERRSGWEWRSGDEVIAKKVVSFFGYKIGWHHQLLHRVTPTLVTPLPRPPRISINADLYYDPAAFGGGGQQKAPFWA